MIINGFEITGEKILRRVSESDLPKSLTDENRLFWMDVLHPDVEVLHRLLGDLELHPLVLETCLEPPPGARLAPFPGCLVVQLPVQATWNDATSRVLSVICLPAAIVTIHSHPVQVIDNLSRDFTSDMQIHDASTSAVLYQIMDQLVDEGMEFDLQARRTVDGLEERVEEDDEDLIGDLLVTKRALSRLAVTLEEQHHCVTSLSTVESKHFSIRGFHEYVRDAVANSEYGLRSVTRLQSRLSEIRQLYQLRLHDKADNRLRILTIISAIFMPLTLLTGIFGMNFQRMPELSWRYGYGGVLALMVLLAGAMLWQFYRRGWFE